MFLTIFVTLQRWVYCCWDDWVLSLLPWSLIPSLLASSWGLLFLCSVSKSHIKSYRQCKPTRKKSNVASKQPTWPMFQLQGVSGPGHTLFCFLVDDFAACDVVDCVCCGLSSASMLCPEVTLVPLRSPSCLLWWCAVLNWIIVALSTWSMKIFIIYSSRYTQFFLKSINFSCTKLQIKEAML